MRGEGDILLVSLYELGHSPLALASAAGFLRRAGFAPRALDLAVDRLDGAALEACRRARLVAISVPMHTAARLATEAVPRIRAHSGAHLCLFGLYAGLARSALADAEVTALTGETEEDLVALAEALDAGADPAAAPADRRPTLRPTLRRLAFVAPDRSLLPPLERYARLVTGDQRHLAGYVEATRGCRHLCRHCPIPVVYGGRFFAVPADVVVDDASRQVAAGARHITFGDPDFFNAPTHALRVARALHARHPEVSFDATIKIEHLVRHRALLPALREAGCVFLVSAVESLSDRVLAVLDKGHMAADVERALAAVRAAGISLRPTFVAFTPWTAMADYLELCHFVARHDLYQEVDPVQLSLRLLIPPGSLLLGRSELSPHLTDLDEAALTWRWKHPDARMDRLCAEVQALVEAAVRRGDPAASTFAEVHDLAARAAGVPERRPPPPHGTTRARAVPHLSEPWFC
jgi:radical SAM superfamily enzyme YgiQ (UPF0313 family)